LGGGESEQEKAIDFGDKTKVVAVHGAKGDKVEVSAVQAEVSKEEKAGEHTVAFGTVRAGVKARNGALSTNDSDVGNGEDPTGGSLEVIGSAVTDEGGGGRGHELFENVEGGTATKVNMTEEHGFPVRQEGDVFSPGLAKDDGFFWG
jgi:hypothetical protein